MSPLKLWGLHLGLKILAGFLWEIQIKRWGDTQLLSSSPGFLCPRKCPRPASIQQVALGIQAPLTAGALGSNRETTPSSLTYYFTLTVCLSWHGLQYPVYSRKSLGNFQSPEKSRNKEWMFGKSSKDVQNKIEILHAFYTLQERNMQLFRKFK